MPTTTTTVEAPPPVQPALHSGYFVWRLLLAVAGLLLALLVLTASGVSTTNNVALGLPVLLAGLLLTGYTLRHIYGLARFFLEPSLSNPRAPDDRQQRLLQFETTLTLDGFFFLSAATVHWALYLLDTAAWSGIGDRLLESGSGSNHFLLFWLCLHNSLIAAIGAASATRFVVQSVSAQVWLDILVYTWYLHTILVVGQVMAAEFGRRERRRDHDPQTV